MNPLSVVAASITRSAYERVPETAAATLTSSWPLRALAFPAVEALPDYGAHQPAGDPPHGAPVAVHSTARYPGHFLDGQQKTAGSPSGDWIVETVKGVSRGWPFIRALD